MKQKQNKQKRQNSQQEAAKAVFSVDGLTTALASLLIDKMYVFPQKRIEIAYKIKDIFWQVSNLKMAFIAG